MRVSSSVAGGHRKADARRRRPRLAALTGVGALVAGLAVALPLTSADATQAPGYDVPTWSTGWSWTYDQTFKYNDGDSTNVTLKESVTYKVTGTTTYAGQSAYKLSLNGNITGGSGSAEGYDLSDFSGNVTGTEYIRRSDLALLSEDQTQNLKAKAHVSIASVSVSASVHLVLTPSPGWETLAFPLNNGDSWQDNETVNYSGGYSYDAGIGGSGSSPLSGSFDFDATARASSVSGGIKVTAHDSNGAQDDQTYSPSKHYLTAEHLAIPLSGSTATLDRTLTSSSTPTPSTTLSETITPSLTCAGAQVTVAGTLSSHQSGQHLTLTLDESPHTPGQKVSGSATTGANGAYSTTLTVPATGDGLGKNGARATWGVIVDGGGASSVATVVVTNQDCTALSYTGATSAPQHGSATVSATLTDLATGRGLSGKTVTFQLSGGATVTATTNSGGVATTTLPVAGPPRSATVTARYAGSSTLEGASASHAFTVAKDGTTTVAAADEPVAAQGDLITFSAAVTPALGSGPTGTVQFQVDGNDLGSPVQLADGQATSAELDTSLISQGTHSVVAVYSGDANFTGSTSVAASFTIKPPRTPSSTDLSVSPSLAVYGQQVTLTATVTTSGTPAGNVTFTDGTTRLGTVSVQPDGTAVLPVSDLAVGSHTVTANFDGGTGFIPSSSNPKTVTVSAAQTTTTITPSATTSVTGQSVTYTVAVAPVAPGAGAPDGTVQLSVDGSPVGDPVTLANGSAAFPAVTMNAGSHAVAVSYSGSANYAASQDGLTQQVSPADTTTTLTASPSPSHEDQVVTLTAGVLAVAPGSGTPTGTVIFRDGSTEIGSAPLQTVDGTTSATFETSTLSTGTHQLTARYVGDDDFAASTSEQVSQTVQEGVAEVGTTTALQSSRNPATYGQLVSFSATVTAEDGSTPTGGVQFSVDGTNIGGPVPLAGGVAVSPTLQAPAPGDHSVIATYVPDTGYAGSGDQLTETVSDASVTVDVASSDASSDYGQSVTFTATVTSDQTGTGVPTGPVQFKVDGAPLGGAVELAGGSATSAAISDLVPGEHAVSVIYAGDVHFLGNVGTATQSVGVISTSTALSASANPITYGDSVTFTATITPSSTAVGAPDGTVTFTDGGTTLGVVPVAADGDHGVAQLNAPLLTAGAHHITATYSGSDNFGGSSHSLTETVGSMRTHIDARPALKVWPLQLTGGQLVASLSTLFGDVPLAGQELVFSIGGTVVCTETTDATGTAICPAAARGYALRLLLAGGYTASFAGSANYLPSSDFAHNID